MLAPITRLRFDDLTEAIPAFAVVTLMSFTYNVGIGITAGLVLYPFCKLVAGRRREVAGGLWVLGHTKRDTLSVPVTWRERKNLRHGDSVMRFFEL